MTQSNDPMGRAIADYWKTGKASKLRVFSPMFDEDEIQVDTLFRSFSAMPETERFALDKTHGKTLDVGAGAGCHSLELQSRGIDVTAIDISPLSVTTMTERGIKQALQKDFFDVEEQYDTILMLMNGIGIVGALDKMPQFFHHLDHILAPGGQVLCDSSDICYVFENDEGIIELPDTENYYGELLYQMQYKNIRGEAFRWLYVDASTLASQTKAFGYKVEIIVQGKHYDYLARITKA